MDKKCDLGINGINARRGVVQESVVLRYSRESVLIRRDKIRLASHSGKFSMS